MFRKVELSDLEKKKLMSEVLRLGIELMFSTHCYTFGGKIYRQTEGGPIGLRSTCAVARVVMARWDSKFKKRLQEINLRTELDGRYVDDGRLVLYPVRPGWRWHRGGMWYRRDWEALDIYLSDIERTRRAVVGAMQGLTTCLSFTTETEEDFSDGWLPTLDLKIKVLENNQVAYSFFSKPTASNRCLQANTALNYNCIMRSLSNEVMRRLANISGHLGAKEKVKVMDEFSQVMVNSGHGIGEVRKTLVNGIKGHERKVERCKKEGKEFHRCAAGSAKSRKKKKLTMKQSWYKNKKDNIELDNETEKQGESKGKKNREEMGDWTITLSKGEKKDMFKKAQQQPSTVLFCNYTKGGTLQKSFRDVVDRLVGLLGFKVRVTERGGTPLSVLLSSKSIGGHLPCGRLDCRVCDQPGEELEQCKQQNIL